MEEYGTHTWTKCEPEQLACEHSKETSCKDDRLLAGSQCRQAPPDCFVFSVSMGYPCKHASGACLRSLTL
eukprot:1141038-Pelagomonas_calceolata.AAC.11